MIGASSETRWSHRLCIKRLKATEKRPNVLNDSRDITVVWPSCRTGGLRCELETRLTGVWVGPVPLLGVRVAAVGQRGARRRAARRSWWRTRFLQGGNTSLVHQRQTQQDAHIVIFRPGLNAVCQSDLVQRTAVFLNTCQFSEAVAATTTFKIQVDYISDKTVDLKQTTDLFTRIHSHLMTCWCLCGVSAAFVLNRLTGPKVAVCPQDFIIWERRMFVERLLPSRTLPSLCPSPLSLTGEVFLLEDCSVSVIVRKPHIRTSKPNRIP